MGLLSIYSSIPDSGGCGAHGQINLISHYNCDALNYLVPTAVGLRVTGQGLVFAAVVVGIRILSVVAPTNL